MSVEYTHFHIPMVGRCGNMIEIREDAWCDRDGNTYPDGYCGCEPSMRGVVFSQIMSAPLNARAKGLDARLYATVRERGDEEAQFKDWELEDMNEDLDYEARNRNRFEMYDISMSMNESYDKMSM